MYDGLDSQAQYTSIFTLNDYKYWIVDEGN